MADEFEHRAYIAIGSNLGDRLTSLQRACKIMDSTEGLRIRRTSGLWQTKAMYVLDQDDFLNGVVEVDTSLNPTELLDRLQQIETELGRIKSTEKGPRTCDLDILLYDDIIYEDERLSIPHALMLERAFVLEPLCELIPDNSPPHATTKPFREYLGGLDPTSRPASTQILLSPTLKPLLPLDASKQTLL